jgi:hypothetical protein
MELKAERIQVMQAGTESRIFYLLDIFPHKMA